MPNILVIEDHETTRKTIALYLERDGFCVETEAHGRAGLVRAMESKFALVIVDLMLPGLDGREICRRLRKESNTPIIMLTALSTEDDIIKGLGLGADDYMTKPFSPRELVARVRARLRIGEEDGHRLNIGELTLDLDQRELKVGSDSVTLTHTEFRILETLMKSPGRAFSRDQLIEHSLGHDYAGSQKNIDIHISNLRKRIEPDRLKPVYILTVTGHGYRFRAA